MPREVTHVRGVKALGAEVVSVGLAVFGLGCARTAPRVDAPRAALPPASPAATAHGDDDGWAAATERAASSVVERVIGAAARAKGMVSSTVSELG